MPPSLADPVTDAPTVADAPAGTVTRPPVSPVNVTPLPKNQEPNAYGRCPMMSGAKLTNGSAARDDPLLTEYVIGVVLLFLTLSVMDFAVPNSPSPSETFAG